MARQTLLQNAFNAGELSPLLEGRTDLGKYANGAALLENFVPTPQGPLIRRPGTRYIGPAKIESNKAWLHPFVFGATQAYVLEFGHLYVRFYANRGTVEYPYFFVWTAFDAYFLNDRVQRNGLTYLCVNDNGGTGVTGADPLADAVHWAWMGPYELATPWAASDLTAADGTFRLRFAQSGDTVYIAHPSRRPHKLSRLDAANFALAAVAFSGGPFAPENLDASDKIHSSGNAGAVALTGTAGKPSAAILANAAYVGAKIRLAEKDVRSTFQWEPGKSFAAGAFVRSNGVNYQAVNSATSGGVKPIHSAGSVYDGAAGVQWTYLDPGFGDATLTATGGAATVNNRIPNDAKGAANATSRWALEAWNAIDGYPDQVCFWRERLVFARGIDIWTSVAGDYENFSARDELGEVAPDMAVSIKVVSREVNPIVWLDPGDDLLIGTLGGEFACREQNKNNPFGPDNVTVAPQTKIGSKSGMVAHRMGASVLHVQRSGTKVRELSYDYGPDSYKSADLTLLAEHVLKGGALHSALQFVPWPIVWHARADGQLVGLTFDREQDVVGWHRHVLGGGGVVESVACIPSPDGLRDELWLIVRRTIAGATRRYVECLESEWQTGSDPKDAFYVDCGLTYSGTPATTVSGLTHLTYASVSALADGVSTGSSTYYLVSGTGTVTLTAPASKVHVGFPCPAKLETLRFNLQGQDGTGQSKTARVHKLNLRLKDAWGLQIGKNRAAVLEPVVPNPYGSGPPAALFSGDRLVEFPGDYGTDPRVYLQFDQCYPATLIALMPYAGIYDR